MSADGVPAPCLTVLVGQNHPAFGKAFGKAMDGKADDGDASSEEELVE